MKTKSITFDKIGIAATALCMIHCIGTPFIFIAKACSTACCADAPLWWQLIDYFFLIITFWVIYNITQSKTKNWLKKAFWISWVLLLFVTINQTLQLFSINSVFFYLPAFSIIILHFYNIKFCKCSTCCE